MCIVKLHGIARNNMDRRDNQIQIQSKFPHCICICYKVRTDPLNYSLLNLTTMRQKCNPKYKWQESYLNSKDGQRNVLIYKNRPTTLVFPQGKHTVLKSLLKILISVRVKTLWNQWGALLTQRVKVTQHYFKACFLLWLKVFKLQSTKDFKFEH